MYCSMPSFPVLHCLLQFTQTHLHWVSYTIQPSHPLPPPIPPVLNLSEHQGLFQCQLFASGGQTIGTSASASVLPMNIQDWFPWELTDLISLQSKGLWKVFSNTTVQKHQFFGAQLFFIVQLSHPYMTTGKTIALTRRTFVGINICSEIDSLTRLSIFTVK